MLKSVVNRNYAAIHFARKMFLDFFESRIGIFFDEGIKLLEIGSSKGRLATLILWPWSYRAFLLPLLSELLYPSGCDLKLLCNVV